MSSLTISIHSLNIKIDEKNLTAEIVSSPHVKGSILIPRSIIKNGREYLITHIGKCSFKDNSTIEKINFPIKLKKIESDAFKDCKNLKSVEIPPNCELFLIENNAFQSSGIEKIDIISHIIQIGSNVFDYCDYLSSIEILSNSLVVCVDFFGCKKEKTVISFPCVLMIKIINVDLESYDHNFPIFVRAREKINII